MTRYEMIRYLTFPLQSYLFYLVNKEIRRITRQGSNVQIKMLDIGGRKSPYSIGIKGVDITISELPRKTDIQKKLNLGITPQLKTCIKKSRSNISDIVYDDFTHTKFPEGSFDLITAVEVIEHVKEDEVFAENLYKVLKPNGYGLLTTPNGDYIKNESPHFNPDHIRHYTKQQLMYLLSKKFKKMDVYYAIKTGKYRVWSRRSWSSQKPLYSFKKIIGSMINRWESRNRRHIPKQSAHLFAIVQKEEAV